MPVYLGDSLTDNDYSVIDALKKKIQNGNNINMKNGYTNPINGVSTKPIQVEQPVQQSNQRLQGGQGNSGNNIGSVVFSGTGVKPLSQNSNIISGLPEQQYKQGQPILGTSFNNSLKSNQEQQPVFNNNNNVNPINLGSNIDTSNIYNSSVPGVYKNVEPLNQQQEYGKAIYSDSFKGATNTGFNESKGTINKLGNSNINNTTPSDQVDNNNNIKPSDYFNDALDRYNNFVNSEDMKKFMNPAMGTGNISDSRQQILKNLGDQINTGMQLDAGIYNNNLDNQTNMDVADLNRQSQERISNNTLLEQQKQNMITNERDAARLGLDTAKHQEDRRKNDFLYGTQDNPGLEERKLFDSRYKNNIDAARVKLQQRGQNLTALASLGKILERPMEGVSPENQQALLGKIAKVLSDGNEEAAMQMLGQFNFNSE